jgi:hypothetical protein
MKKILYTLMAATLCLMVASCGNPASRIQSLAENIENNGDDWTDADQWEGVLEDFATATCDFLESDFTEDEAIEFGEACSSFMEAISDIDDRKAKKAMEKGAKAIGKNKELNKRLKKAGKRAEKYAEDQDLDEDEIRDAFRGIHLL